MNSSNTQTSHMMDWRFSELHRDCSNSMVSQYRSMIQYQNKSYLFYFSGKAILMSCGYLTIASA